MRNIPMFATQYGVASLTLQDIPYRGDAYIKIQSSAEPEELLKECIGFCTMAGAERIYAAGDSLLEAYPFHTAILRMSGTVSHLRTDVSILPVTAGSLERWREIYNQKMENVPNASYMSSFEAQKLLKEGNGYFVHSQGDLLGIGIASGDEIKAIASVKPGAGADVFAALCGALASEDVQLEVASTNVPALRLYEKMGLICTAEVSRWYRVYPKD